MYSFGALQHPKTSPRGPAMMTVMVVSWTLPCACTATSGPIRLDPGLSPWTDIDVDALFAQQDVAGRSAQTQAPADHGAGAECGVRIPLQPVQRPGGRGLHRAPAGERQRGGQSLRFGSAGSASPDRSTRSGSSRRQRTGRRGVCVHHPRGPAANLQSGQRTGVAGTPPDVAQAHDGRAQVPHRTRRRTLSAHKTPWWR